MFEFINFLPVAGEFIATLAAWFLPALVAGLLVAWGLAMSNDTSILDDFIVWEVREEEQPPDEVEANLNLKEENIFLREEIRALARDNDELLEEVRLLQEALFRERNLQVVDLRVEEVRLLEAHLRDVGTCARA